MEYSKTLAQTLGCLFLAALSIGLCGMTFGICTA